MNTSLRRAALTLHGLSQEDRAWVLEQLPISTKRELELLVSELNELGFDADELPAFDAAFAPISMTASNSTVEFKKIDDDVVARIEMCPMSLLVSWINEEAEWVVAQVLEQRAWSWTNACLQQIDIDKRNRLSRMRQDIRKVPPLVGIRLLKRLSEHLASKPLMSNDWARLHTVDPAPADFMSEVKRWLRSFTRRG